MSIYISQLFFPQKYISSINLIGDRTIKEPMKELSLRIAKFFIPSKATVENISVYEAYEPLWAEMLTDNQSNYLLIQNALSVIAGSTLVLKNYYIFGDFGGLCLRQRFVSLFKRNN